MVMPSRYLFVQKFNFALLGINPLSADANAAIERPLLCYGLISITFFNLLLVCHYIYVNRNDYLEVSDVLPLCCQTTLTFVKIGIFIRKRHEIMDFIKVINQLNRKAKGSELSIVRRENHKEIFIGTLYLRTVTVTAIAASLHPLFYAAYVYLSSGQWTLVIPNKGSYFWPNFTLAGYLLIFLINIAVVYFLSAASLAIDTLFCWFIHNILAQYYILFYRLHNINMASGDDIPNYKPKSCFEGIVTCIRHHCQTIDLADKLNELYGGIILIKFIILCMEICCLLFYVLNSNDSMIIVIYKCSYLSAVAIQLSLYCYCGQWIKDESSLIATEIYDAFDWSVLNKSCKKMLLIAMERSKRCSNIRGLFFEVFKTAASYMTALKTLEENRK